MKRRIIIMSLVSLLACREDTEWEVEESEVRLVVEAEVSDDKTEHFVALTSTQSYFDTQEPIPVSGAAVTISSGSETYVMAESVFPGLYINEVPFTGEIGETYLLRIALEKEIHGNTIYTAESTIHEAFKIDSLAYYLYDKPETTLFNYESRVYFSVYGSEPPQAGDYYLLNVLKNQRNLTERVEHTLVWDDNWFNGLPEVHTGDFGFFEPITESDTLTLEIRSIDKEYYDFINSIKLEVGAKDPFGFIGAPANLQGNVSNGGLGYFIAYASRKRSVVVD